MLKVQEPLAKSKKLQGVTKSKTMVNSRTKGSSLKNVKNSEIFKLVQESKSLKMQKPDVDKSGKAAILPSDAALVQQTSTKKNFKPKKNPFAHNGKNQQDSQTTKRKAAPASEPKVIESSKKPMVLAKFKSAKIDTPSEAHAGVSKTVAKTLNENSLNLKKNKGPNKGKTGENLPGNKGIKPNQMPKPKSRHAQAKKRKAADANPNAVGLKKPALAAKVTFPAEVITKSSKTAHGKKEKTNKSEKPAAKDDENTQKKSLTKQEKLRASRRAYRRKRAILKRKLESGTDAAKKLPTIKYEAPEYDESEVRRIVSQENIIKMAKTLKEIVQQQVETQKATVFTDYTYQLSVSCFKIPNCPRRYVKLHLKHSIVCEADEVAIIVADLERGAKIDYNPTIQHYEDKFRAAGIERKLKIVPYNKIRNEATSFEEKRQFCNSYSYFLCDGRIIGQAHGFLGKAVSIPRKLLHSVRMDAPDLKKEIDKALCRTAYRQTEKGDLICMPIGNHEFTEEKIADNIIFVMEQLQKEYPGGWPNIRSLYLKISIAGTSALPIYISMAKPPAEVPYIVGPREERMLKLKREANQELTSFVVTKEAKLVKLNDTQAERKRQTKEALTQLKIVEKSNGGNCNESSENEAEENTHNESDQEGGGDSDKEKVKDAAASEEAALALALDVTNAEGEDEPSSEEDDDDDISEDEEKDDDDDDDEPDLAISDDDEEKISFIDDEAEESDVEDSD